MNLLNKFKRGLAALLSLSVAVSAVFVFHFPLIRAYAEGEHSHEEWKEWTEWTESNNLPEDSDKYYLSGDVTISETWTPKDGTYLCLNGNSISISESIDVILVEENVSFTLCDSPDASGIITHSFENGRGVNVAAGGTFNMLGGTIVDNGGYGVFLEKGGTMTVGGTAKITDKVYLCDEQLIIIDKSTPLSYGAEICVETQTPPEKDKPVSVTAENDDDYSTYFKSEDYSVINDKNTVMLAVKTQENPGGHNPGGDDNSGDDDNTSETHTHDGDTYIEWSETTRLPEVSGRYYLNEDVELGTKWTIEKNAEIKLCLNGNSIIMNVNDTAISVMGSLTVYDCTEALEKANAITHNGGNGAGVSIGDEASFAMYSGTISGNNGAGVTFEVGENGSTGTLTVGGTAKILDEVNLPSGKTITIDDNKPLTEGAKIVVKIADEPTDEKGVDIAKKDTNDSIDYSQFFESDDGYNKKYADKTVVFEKVVQENPDEHKHGDKDKADWKPFIPDDNGSLPTGAGHYYLKGDITIPDTWSPAEGTYLCLNGHTISSKISVTKPGFTLCNCKSTGSAANVTVKIDNGEDIGKDKTITVGGTLNANITLSDGALIDVDSDNPLTGSITVALAEPLAEGEVAITTEKAAAYSDHFNNKQGYIVKVADGVVKLKKEKTPVVGPSKHNHPICGDSDCRARHNAPDEWTPWTERTYLPTTQGYYYLENDVTLYSAWNPSGDTYLCLNGHDITLIVNGEDSIIKILENDSLTLCDCATYPNGSDKIVNNLKSATTVSQVNKQLNENDLGTVGGSIASGIVNNGLFMMYGGVIKNNGASGVRNSSDFVMLGGVIIDNSASNGGGVFNRGISSNSAIFTMDGGVIAGNTAAYKGGGLYNEGVAIINDGRIFANKAEGSGGGVYQDGTLTVDHGAYITGNTANGKKNNVYILAKRPIKIGASLSGTVGVTLENTPTGSGKVEFASGTVNSNTLKRIKSDNSSFTINQSKGTLTLSKKTSSSNDDDRELELDVSAPLSSASIPKEDRTAIIDLLKTMPNWVVGAYYDVTLYEDNEEISEYASFIDVELNIPSSIRSANRVFKVIRVHDGKATLLDDIDSDPNTVTVRSKLFSTYAIIYSVSQNGAASGSGSGTNGGYGNPAMGVRNEIPLAGLACGFTVLALAAPGKKLEQ